MATTNDQSIPARDPSEQATHLRLISPRHSMTYAEAIDELIDNFSVYGLGEDCSENQWFKALESDVRRIHDLADTFCDDLSRITGVRFRRASHMKLERVVRGLLVDDIRLVRDGRSIATMSARLAHEARQYLTGLPSAIETKFRDGSGTPRFVPASPIMDGGDGRKFFNFPSRDKLAVEMVVMEDTRYWPPDRFPGSLPYSCYEAIRRANNETELLWHTAVMDGTVVGATKNDDPVLVLLAGESGMCPIAVDWWDKDNMGQPSVWARLRIASRTPAVRLLAVMSVLVLLMVAWLLAPASAVGAAGAIFFSAFACVLGLLAWGLASRGRRPSFLYPWRLIPATHAQV